MRRARFQCLAVLCISVSPLLTGCVALSLGIGGKTQQVVADSSETKDRVNNLEARVAALEQQLTLPPPLNGISGPTETGPVAPSGPGLEAQR